MGGFGIMCTKLDKKVYSVLKLIPQNGGINIRDLERSLIEDYNGEYIFNSFCSFDELLQTNILIGRLEHKGDTLYMTDRGKHYLEKLKVICEQPTT